MPTIWSTVVEEIATLHSYNKIENQYMQVYVLLEEYSAWVMVPFPQESCQIHNKY